MNPFDLTKTNPFNIPNSNNNPRPIVPNPFLTNNSIGPSPRRSDNLGLNNSVQQNTYINDVIQVVIDSRNRNIKEYPLPNDYTLEFAKPFNTVKEISLSDINISNTLPPVNVYNNSLIFEYPSTNTVATNILLPPTTSLDDEIAVFGTQIKEGFYNTITLTQLLESTLSQIKHSDEFIEVTPGSRHNFTFDINPQTHLVQIVNRIEKVPIYAIQTILNVSDDILATYRVGAIPVTATGLLITVRQVFDDSYPLVITDADVDINWQTFFLSTAGHPYSYEAFDQLLINGITYYRYKLSFPDLLLTNSQNTIYTMSGGNLTTILLNANITDFVSNVVNKPLVGRALPTRLIYQRSQITNETCRLNHINEDGSVNTILELLGWNMKNNEITETNTVQFQYINTNHGSYLPAEISFSASVNGYNNSLPNRLMRLEHRDNLYWFRSEDYIFLKIIINAEKVILIDKLVIGEPIKMTGTGTDINNTVYNVKPNGTIVDAQRLQKKNNTNLFAKIDLELFPINTRGFIRNYIVYNINFKNEQLDVLSEIRVQFIDRHGRLLNLRGEHNFVLEIVTKRNVLDNILMNTKYG